jgi:hypothetical protein
VNEWTHSCCDDCWYKHNPVFPTLADEWSPLHERGPEDTCCFCGVRHRTGIYVRENPEKAPCKGKHE